MCIQKLNIIVKIRKRLIPVIWLGNLQWYICRLNTDLGLLNEWLFFNSDGNMCDLFRFQRHEARTEQVEL